MMRDRTPGVGDSPNPRIVLASASPRRRELLQQIGVAFRVAVADIVEQPLQEELPGDFVLRMAREKALVVMRREAGHLPVLGADTAVVLEDRILGKPASRNEAAEMLKSLSGNTHEVFSAVAVAVSESEVFEALNISRVTFSELEPEWIQSYIESGDPMDKAGAYGVQGKAGEKISRIEGSFYGVMGLPLYETAQLLKRAGV
jgi:septum formation protein